MENLKTKKETHRIAGKLKEIVTVHDDKGQIIHKLINPLHVEFTVKDMLQIMIGASILAIPVGFTEETWNLGAELPMRNVIMLMLISLFFISIFVYYNYYRNHLEVHTFEYIKRVISTYLFSFLIVAMLLALIQRTPWVTDWVLSFKRIVLVTFPASMSAVVADTFK